MLDVMFNAVSIASGASADSPNAHLRDGFSFHALEYEISGAGTVALSVLESISGKSYIVHAGAGSGMTGLTASSGPGSDGKGHIDLFLKPADFIRVRASATVNTAVVTVWLVQK